MTDASTERPDRILILRRGDFRLAVPLLDVVDPTPLGVLLSALPMMVAHIDGAPPGADVGPPLDDDASVLMLRVVGDDDPLVPDVGLIAQTEGRWDAGGPDAGGRTDATARVPELELEVIDVERPVIALRGSDLELNVLSDTWGTNAGDVAEAAGVTLAGDEPDAYGGTFDDVPPDSPHGIPAGAPPPDVAEALKRAQAMQGGDE
jgi:hypothetical protein